MKSLNEDLKTGQFSQIYLLYGEENYLKKQYKERFVKAMLPQGDTMNYAYYEGKGVEIREVIDLAETLPFFAERRLIVFENTGLFKSSGADLAEYIKTMPETTYFIFVEEEVDKRSKLYKAVKAKGHIVELPFQDESTLKRWILGNVRREGKQISDASVGYFLGKVGTDMQNIQGELEKLFCYTLHRDVITPEDIDAVCINQIGNHIFEMVNAIAEHNQRRALDLYYDLLTLKEPPMRIMYLITRQFQILLHLRDMAGKGFDNQTMAQKAGIPPFAVKRNLTQARGFGAGQLRQALEDGVALEEAVKTGRMNDQMAVELFIIRYSAAKQKK